MVCDSIKLMFVLYPVHSLREKSLKEIDGGTEMTKLSHEML